MTFTGMKVRDKVICQGPSIELKCFISISINIGIVIRLKTFGVNYKLEWFLLTYVTDMLNSCVFLIFFRYSKKLYEEEYINQWRGLIPV